MNTKSILIVKLSAIGDVVHCLPVLEVLRKNYPDARIDWVVEQDAADILEGHPLLNRLIISRRKSWQKDLPGIKCLPAVRDVFRFLRELRSQYYDLVIDLQGLFKSGVITGLSKGGRKIGMTGSREGAEWFLNEKPVPVDYSTHAVKRYLSVTEYLGLETHEWVGGIPVSGRDVHSIEKVFETFGLGKRPLVAVNPMAKWTTKLWKTEHFALLSDRVIDELGCDIIFTGSSGDRAVLDEIRERMHNRAPNLAGLTSLKELSVLYQRSALMITTDTGPMHIAAAMGCPVIALFGPTSPYRTGPYGKGHTVIRKRLECGPCFRRRCGNPRCMNEISVDAVFEVVKKRLAEKAGKPEPEAEQEIRSTSDGFNIKQKGGTPDGNKQRTA